MNILLGAFVTMSAFIIGMDGCGKLYVRVVLEPRGDNMAADSFVRYGIDDYNGALQNGGDLIQSASVAGRKISQNLSSLLQIGENIHYG